MKQQTWKAGLIVALVVAVASSAAFAAAAAPAPAKEPAAAGRSRQRTGESRRPGSARPHRVVVAGVLADVPRSDSVVAHGARSTSPVRSRPEHADPEQ